MKAIHELKIHPQYLNKIKLKEKTFELRKDDRDYEIGDTIMLKGYINGHYTIEYAYVRIVYILRDYEGLAYDYCILGIECISYFNKGNDCDTCYHQYLSGYYGDCLECKCLEKGEECSYREVK